MIAAKASEASRVKGGATAQANTIGAPTGLHRAQNPFWAQLALRPDANFALSQPADPHEQEADRVAEQMLSRSSPVGSVQPAGAPLGVYRMCATCEEELPLLHRTSAHSEPSAAPVHGPSTSSAFPPARSSGPLATLGAGTPLPAAVRREFEGRFGEPFGSVRIHTDDRASEAAADLDALAFTYNDHIVFARNGFDPYGSTGRRLLAHELTHVLQQGQGAGLIQRESDPAAGESAHVYDPAGVAPAAPETLPAPDLTKAGDQPAPVPAPATVDTKALEADAKALETEILANSVYSKLAWDSKQRVKNIIAIAKAKPLGNDKGQRNYYLTKLKLAITTPFDGKETGKAEYGCSAQAEKDNRAAVDKALAEEKKWWDGLWADVEENVVATGTNKVSRTGEGGKKFLVDRTDPTNIRVQIKIRLKGKTDDVKDIKKLEDAIERESHTKGYTLDIVFVDKGGTDVFDITVNFCLWANSGNWASSPTALSHEVHHLLGLGDRYDYIESHADNTQMNVPMRLVWFEEQMNKATGDRDPYSKMSTSSNPLLAEDVCAVAFNAGPDRQKCIDARKGLDPSNVPAP